MPSAVTMHSNDMRCVVRLFEISKMMCKYMQSLRQCAAVEYANVQSCIMRDMQSWSMRVCNRRVRKSAHFQPAYIYNDNNFSSITQPITIQTPRPLNARPAEWLLRLELSTGPTSIR